MTTLARYEMRHRHRCASSGGDLHHDGVRICNRVGGRKEDDAVAVPSAATPVWSVCQDLRRTSSNIDPFSLASAKTPTDRPSGAQKGSVAPSVPPSGRAVVSSSRRTHNVGAPSVAPTKTSWLPSGDSANEVKSDKGGVDTSNRTSCCTGTGRRSTQTDPAR